MTDDFQLFASPDDGDRPIDADLALITAYLARELSPMQVLAVEERLISDADFRATVQPLLDAWSAPIASLGAVRAATLTEKEKAEGWRRFRHEVSTGEQVAPNSHRRISMKRVAAVIGITVLPMVTFAQAVVYSANNENAPGHELAQRLVAFVGGSSRAPIAVPVIEAPVRAADVPVTRQLPAPAPLPVQKAPRVEVAAPVVTEPMTPNRAKIIALAKEYQPAVARGDTAVDYIVMVLDASEKYQWSTYGHGNVLIQVAGDTRTFAERSAMQREYQAELRGTAIAAGRGGGGGRGGARGGGGVAAGGFARRQIANDSVIVIGERAVMGRVTVDSGTRIIQPDSSAFQRRVLPGRTGDSARTADSLYPRQIGTGGGGRGGSAGGGYSIFPLITRDTAAGGQIQSRQLQGRARGGGGDSSAFGSLVYQNGYVNSSFTTMNDAPGLQDITPTESGIQGLLAKNVASAETYLFGPGELSPKPIRVIVVQMVAGTNWRRSF